MSSSLVEFENSGILRMINRLSVLNTTSGIINHTDEISIVSLVGSLLQYANGAYDDDYARLIAAGVLDGDGVKVLSATRVDKIGILSIELTAPFEVEVVTIRIPHGAYE